MTLNASILMPALGAHWLTPAYDLAVRALTRERRWRRALLKQIDPRPRERIADVGCGTGSQAILLKRASPLASIYGLDPDPDILARAEAKASRAGAGVHFVHALPHHMAARLMVIHPNKIVSSLVFHQVPLPGKRELLKAMFDALPPGGQIHIADYGWRRTAAMRAGFRIVQSLDGVENTQPNVDGCMPALLEDAGFTRVAETTVIPAMTGSISLYRGTRP